MHKIPVVFTFDKRIVLGAATAIKSLIDSAKNDTRYDIYVYHPDLGNNTIKEFTKMLDGTNHSITFEYISKDRFKNAPINKNGSWTEIVYYRLLIPELLQQYDKVIYSDVDVLFKDDLTDLYNTDLTGYEWAGVRAEKNTPNIIGHKYFEENKKDYIFWSGLMLLNCAKMREANFIQKCYETINQFGSRLKFFDLDTINLASTAIKPLDFRYVTLQSIYYNDKLTDAGEYEFLKQVYSDSELLSAKENPAIVHYAGKPGKPWRRKYIPQDYKECLNTIPKKLRQYTFRDIRKILFSKV